MAFRRRRKNGKALIDIFWSPQTSFGDSFFKSSNPDLQITADGHQYALDYRLLELGRLDKLKSFKILNHWLDTSTASTAQCGWTSCQATSMS